MSDDGAARCEGMSRFLFGNSRLPAKSRVLRHDRYRCPPARALPRETARSVTTRSGRRRR
ncbi:hypothetical protein BLAT2472_90207 [Burkholderia latens]